MPYRVRAVDPDFDLDPVRTVVASKMQVERNRSVPHGGLRLDGEELELLRVLVDGVEVTCTVEDGDLLVAAAPDADFLLEIRSACAPEKNTALSGLFVSGSGLFTHCEAEGFRRITWFLDRPDVMAVLTVAREDGNRFAAGTVRRQEGPATTRWPTFAGCVPLARRKLRSNHARP